MPTTKYKPFYYSCITRLEKERKKQNLTPLFSVASFLYSPFLQGSEKVSLCREIHQDEKKVPRSFFHYGARKKLPCELISNFFILGLYLNSGTGLWLIFLVKVLMMVTLCLSIYSHWFYPKEMEIIGIFTYTHAF